ncbi:hypothetical protein PR002_g30266 [Phytophthora rubi]|uniref:RxLR effector protein n=1 Tax=Phytophthora rubi TaxID=129364 RepID=A0A6A3GTE5_9STRA|nr:hypothetical protein PR002_g30266 [Phytophthora rubi]
MPWSVTLMALAFVSPWSRTTPTPPPSGGAPAPSSSCPSTAPTREFFGKPFLS